MAGDERLTVACVLRSGGIYDARWVSALQRGVSRHMTVPHRFVCLSDVQVPCERIPIVHDWPRWWAKIELFRHLAGPTLYFDLDTVITGSLDDVAAYPHRFTAAHDFYHDGLCSTALAWDGDYSHIYRAFDPSMMRRYDQEMRPRIGDQAFIEDHVGEFEYFRDLMPGQIVSYKVDCQDGLPADARAVAFHGHIKQNKVNTPWVRRNWHL